MKEREREGETETRDREKERERWRERERYRVSYVLRIACLYCEPLCKNNISFNIPSLC